MTDLTTDVNGLGQLNQVKAKENGPNIDENHTDESIKTNMQQTETTTAQNENKNENSMNEKENENEESGDSGKTDNETPKDSNGGKTLTRRESAFGRFLSWLKESPNQKDDEKKEDGKKEENETEKDEDKTQNNTEEKDGPEEKDEKKKDEDAKTEESQSSEKTIEGDEQTKEHCSTSDPSTENKEITIECSESNTTIENDEKTKDDCSSLDLSKENEETKDGSACETTEEVNEPVGESSPILTKSDKQENEEPIVAEKSDQKEAENTKQENVEQVEQSPEKSEDKSDDLPVTEGKEDEKEMTESEKNNEASESETPRTNRFLSWLRGPPKEESKTNEENDEKEEKDENNETTDDDHVKIQKNVDTNKEENETSDMEELNDTQEEKESTKEESDNIQQKTENDKTEMKDEAKTTEEGEETPKLKRFLSWWRGKPKEEDKTIEKDKKTEDTHTPQGSENKDYDVMEAKNNVASNDDMQEVRISTVADSHLENITAESKEKLAIGEDGGDCDTATRTLIDSVSTHSENAEDKESNKTTTIQTSQVSEVQPGIQAIVSVEKTTAIRHQINQESTQTSDKLPVDNSSENNEECSRASYSGTAKELNNQSQQEEGSKLDMEEVTQETRQDARQENMQEAWKQIEPSSPSKETGSKTFRVSYTIRTETTETKETKKQIIDEDMELIDDSVLNSAPKTLYEGPPPEDLEAEIQAEHAREDEAAVQEIDNFFEQCKEENGHAPLAQDETIEATAEGTTQKETKEDSKPSKPEDIFTILHKWDDEPTDWWTITKRKKHYDEWMKPMKDGTIRRVIIPCVEIPYQTSVRFITDWKHREEWDKTFSEIKVLKSDKQSKTVYCPVKKRDLTFETLEQEEENPPCYVLSWKKQDVINKESDTTPKKNKEIQLITHACGIILRPAEVGDHATKITILCQLEGEVDSVLKTTFLSGHPKTWLQNLKKYYKKHQMGDSKKVVHL